jgi:hypothetical protein
MKHLLLFLLFIVAVSAACKKPKKKEAPAPISVDTLIGNWTDQLPLSSSMFPATYSFRADRTYSRFFGIGPMLGTYQINAGSTANNLDVTLTETGASTTRIYIEITSRDRMVVTFQGSTAGRPFVRVP